MGKHEEGNGSRKPERTRRKTHIVSTSVIPRRNDEESAVDPEVTKSRFLAGSE